MTFDTFWTLYKALGPLVPGEPNPELEKRIEMHARAIWLAAQLDAQNRSVEIVWNTPATGPGGAEITGSRWTLIEAFRRQVVARIQPK